MDKKKSILNVCVSIGFKIATLIMAIIARKALIENCGNEVNGLNTLYTSIIGFLSVAELGVGSAITYCMYRPIVENNREKVAALYHAFRRMYLFIGSAIFLAGLAIMPFVRFFAKDYAQVNVNFHLTFALMLISVVLTYLFGAKTALFNAHKNNYITTAINSGCILLQNACQIIVLHITHSFVCYLVCSVLTVIIQWGITEKIVRKKYTLILSDRVALDVDSRRELTVNVKAMFMHKIGGILVNTVDSVVISAFIGVYVLGSFSNYSTIMNSLSGLLQLVFVSLTSIFGHYYVEKGRQKAKECYEVFHLLNFIIGMVFFLGYYAIIDDLIALVFSEELILEKAVSTVITLNGFIQFMRRSALTFRDATGTFYNDRWKPLLEGLTNLVLSILLVKQIGVTGVIVATIITNLLICHIVEPYVLYKYAFLESPKWYYARNYGMMALFLLGLVVYNMLDQTGYGHWKQLLVNGAISVCVSAGVCLVAMLLNWKTCRKAVQIKKA